MSTLQTDRTDTDRRFEEIVDDLTRRGLLGGVVGTAALVGLAACGSGGADRGSGSVATRKVSTVHGTVAVPGEPKRIVAFDFPEACALLDLGVTPIGRPSYMPAFPAYTSALKGVPSIFNTAGTALDIERIATLTPDLIVGDDWADPKQQRASYDKLSKIAPTAIFVWEQAAGNWPDLAAQTAAAIGRSDDLDRLKARYAARAAAIKKADTDLFARTTWDIIDCGKDSWDLYSDASSHGHVLTGAGVRLGAGASQTDGYKQYSLEELGRLAHTDVIVTTTASLPFLKKLAIFRDLPAAKAGRVYTTDLFFPASYGIALALLDDLASFCAKAAAA